MGLLQGIRLYPKAIFWAGLISLCCAMEGYDIALIGNFYAFLPFNRKYGELQPNGSYQVPAEWQAGISNGAQCGQIVGLLRSCPSPSLRYFNLLSFVGHWLRCRENRLRPFLLGVLFYQCAVTTIFFVAPSVKILLLGECLAGIAFGFSCQVYLTSWFEHTDD